jgi:hypothetical protein
VLATAQTVIDGDEPSKDRWVQSLNVMMSRFDLLVEPTDCRRITISGNGREAGGDFDQDNAWVRHLLACTVSPHRADPADIEQRRKMTKVFDRVVTWCPRLFRPRYSVLEKSPDGWFANYTDTDTMLHLESGRLFMTEGHAAQELYLGAIEDWETSVPQLDCDSMPIRLRNLY